jgi:hypothetical protein
LNNFSVINGQWMAKRNASLLETTVPLSSGFFTATREKFRLITGRYGKSGIQGDAD